MSRLRRIFALIALALVLAPLAAFSPLFDPDEGLHAAIAQEMNARGDYVTPTFLGDPFLDKPILFFWAEAASLKLFGDNEAAVRIPPLMFGLLGMVSVALLGRALFGERAGLIAGIAYGTMLLPMGVSEVAVHDIGLVPFLCVAALCLTRVDEGGNVWRAGLVAGVALGLSILTKGLVGVVFAGIFAVCLTARRFSSAARMAVTLTVAIVVAILVAAPWYVAMERAHPGYLHYYFIERHLAGYLTTTQRHAGRPFWYYGPIVLGGALPWTPYLVVAGLALARGKDAVRAVRRDSRQLAIWAWFGIGLVFLSIGESKLVTYVLPLFPALAIIVGEYVSRSVVDHHPEGASPQEQSGGSLFRAALAMHIVTLALLPALGLIVLQWKFGASHVFLWIAVVLLGLLTIDAGRRAARAPSGDAFMAGVARMAVYTILGLMMVSPAAATWMTGRDLARVLNAGAALPSRVYVIDERIGSLIFYLDPPLRAQVTRDRVSEASFSDAVARMRVDPPDALFAVRNGQLPRFKRLFPSPPPRAALAGTFSVFRADTLRAALQSR